MKRVLIIIALFSVGCTSCSVDLSGQDASTKIDSIVNERVRLLKAEHRRNNDSIIHSLAMERAATIFPPDSVAPKNNEHIK